MLKPAGFAWLFAHEIRLLWRNSILLRTSRHILIPLLLVGIFFQGAALLLANILQAQSLSLPILILIANINLIFLGGLMLSRALSLTIDVLYARGDADFLLAAPIPPVRILAVRMLGVAASTAAPWVLLAGVLANALALHGHPVALTGYLSVSLLAGLATAIGFFVVVFLTARTPPATARKLSQSLALFMGILIFAGGQAPRFLPGPALRAFWQNFLPTAQNLNYPRWLPARAALGQALPLSLAIMLVIAVFMLVLYRRAGQFAQGVISTAASTAAPATNRPAKGFPGNPFAAAFIKNLLLLLRFPGLLTQTVYRSLTLIPAAIILTGHLSLNTNPAIVVPLLVFLTGQLALFFISIITGGDQSPELLASAPVAPATGRRAAYAAAFYATAIIMALPVIAMLLRAPGRLTILLAAMAGVALCNLVLGNRYPIPLFRPAFGKTQTGTVFGLILGVAVSSLWGLAAWLVVAPHPLTGLN